MAGRCSRRRRDPARNRKLRPRLRLHRLARRSDAPASGDRTKQCRPTPSHQGALRAGVELLGLLPRSTHRDERKPSAADDLLCRRYWSDPYLDFVEPLTPDATKRGALHCCKVNRWPPQRHDVVKLGLSASIRWKKFLRWHRRAVLILSQRQKAFIIATR